MSYNHFHLSNDIHIPNTIMMIYVIRGRFRVLRYDVSVLKLAIHMIPKKSNRIASLPSAGNCGYAHPSIPYQTIVTKR